MFDKKRAKICCIILYSFAIVSFIVAMAGIDAFHYLNENKRRIYSEDI